MLPQIALTILSAVAVTAGPVRRQCGHPPSGPGPQPGPGPLPAPSNPPQNPEGTPQPVVTPTLPVNGGAKELEGPGSLSFKAVLVGHGIQNYTCKAAGEKATATGALAMLWDITPLYPGMGPQSLSSEAWNGLSASALHTTDIPLKLAGDAAHPYAADLTAPFPASSDLSLEGVQGSLKFAGHHYFLGGTPTFDLHALPGNLFFSSKKNDGIPAPGNADKGITGSGAVDWLALGDAGGSNGIKLGYRVFTAGGVAASCTQEGQTDNVPYTAQYWFFG